jgi:hypothetical protein
LDELTIIFVALMLGVATVLTLTVRSQIKRNVERKREEQHQLEEASRRQAVARNNPGAAMRRSR